MAEKGRKAYETNNGQSSAAAGPNWQALHRQGCLGKYHDYLESVTRFESGACKDLVPRVALQASGRLLEK